MVRTREEKLAYWKAYNAKRSAERSAALRAARAADPEKYRARERAYAARHREEKRQATRAWLEANPVRSRLSQCGYRFRHTVRTLTLDEWNEILAEFDGACAYCERSDVKITVDHVIPLTRGGTHTRDNVVPACLSCNCTKRNRLLAEWFGFTKKRVPTVRSAEAL